MSDKRLNFAQFTKQFIGKPYELGRTDCAMVVLALSKHAGFDVVDITKENYRGMNVKNYPELYRRDPEKAADMLISWATEGCKPIPVHRAFTGDLIVAVLRKTTNKTPSLVIHAGQDLGLVVSEHRGVILVPLKDYEFLKVYRWREKRKPKLMTMRKYKRWKEE